jgi:hypothetical protein
MQRRLSFLICGTQKGGTTALVHYLQQHPDVALPECKELHFFDDETINWQRPNYRKYHQHFSRDDDPKAKGEATPIYMYWEPSAERIWRYNPAMRLIVILRNPITRAYSHWSMERGRGAEQLSFGEALAAEADRSRSTLPLQDRVGSYVDRGFYCAQLRRLWRFFGREAVLVLRQEDLLEQHQVCLDRVCAHLGLPPMPPVAAERRHEGHYDQIMDADCKHRLRELFWHEICQLEAMLGWDCRSWLQG